MNLRIVSTEELKRSDTDPERTIIVANGVQFSDVVRLESEPLTTERFWEFVKSVNAIAVIQGRRIVFGQVSRRLMKQCKLRQNGYTIPR